MYKRNKILQGYTASNYLGPHITYLNNSRKNCDGHIYKSPVFDDDFNVNDLRCCEMDYQELLCDDIMLTSELMTYDREDYFINDGKI